MVQIPRHHAAAVLRWLDATVAPNCPGTMPDRERTEESRLNPHSISATAQVAYWQSQNQEWQITQWGYRRYIEVRCQDPQVETLISLRWLS